MKTMVYTFLRAQPPTKAHIMVIDTVLELAKDHNADYNICISHTHDPANNPLTWNDKCKIITEVRPLLNIFDDYNCRTPFSILEHFGKIGYKKVIFVVGGDRHKEFYEGMSPYIDDWGIKDFRVHNAGDRDPDLDNFSINGISGTYTRTLVKENNYNEFKKCLPDSLSEDTKVSTFNLLREALVVNALTGK